MNTFLNKCVYNCKLKIELRGSKQLKILESNQFWKRLTTVLLLTAQYEPGGCAASVAGLGLSVGVAPRPCWGAPAAPPASVFLQPRFLRLPLASSPRRCLLQGVAQDSVLCRICLSPLSACLAEVSVRHRCHPSMLVL